VGPTASGKSALALEAARRLPGPPVEIVSVDSMQVYRGMDVGTAKPTAAERAEVPHHLLDLAEPDDDFTVTRFQEAFAQAINAIEARGHRALLVGGTGLYLRAVVDRLTPPGRYPSVRSALEAEATAGLYSRLTEADPQAAAKIEPGNRRRVVRALEVTLGSGRPFSSYGPGLDVHPPTRFRMAGLWLPRPVVARRIEERVRHMLDHGLPEEARRLAERPPGLSRTARQALGYKEVLDGLPAEAAAAEITRRTKAFARRQRVWFRRDPRIVWYGARENPLAVLPALLGDWSRCH
jgi:tRNA dimethylallyltransferase